MRRAPGDQARLVGAVQAHHAAPGPVGQVRGVGARAHRERAVDRRARDAELLADVEAPARRRVGARADADARGHDLLARAVERDAQRRAVEVEEGADGVVLAQGAPRDPAGDAVGALGDADLHPRVAVGVAPRGEHEVDLGQVVLGQPAQLGHGARRARGTRADLRVVVRIGPARQRALVAQALHPRRVGRWPVGAGGRGGHRGGEQSDGGDGRGVAHVCVSYLNEGASGRQAKGRARRLGGAGGPA
jgi:hypothetical protein